MSFKVRFVPLEMIGSSFLVIISLALASIFPAVRASRLRIRRLLLMSKIKSILRAFLMLFVVGFCWPARWSAAAATPDAEALLKRSDSYRNGWPSYVLRVKITHYESGKADEDKLYEVSQKGTEKTYVEF